jgi:high affinity Mn2+ porin
MLKFNLLAAVTGLAGATATAADLDTNSVAGPAIETASTNAVQNWNIHAQNTETVQGYPGFSSQYSGPNSLPSGGETRETVSLDLMAGLRLWSGAEAHIDGLMWQGFGLDNTLGVEGFPNGEAYRIGTQVPNGMIARLFIRQTIGLGGEQQDIPDDQLDLAGTEDISRLTFTLGQMSAADIFDKNTYANDPRTQFMNWGLVNNEAWDYSADSVGYTTGLAIELNQPNWTLRYGFFQVPRNQNGLMAQDHYFKWPYDPSADGPSNDGPFFSAWAMVTELERRYSIGTHPGTIRFLAFLNRANMANYAQATSILEAGGPGTGISGAQAYRYKYGFGVNWEQEIAQNVGVFSRLGWNDGREEGWMFSDVGYAGSLGLSIAGAGWHRPNDTVGLAGVINGISNTERDFLAAGGLGILAGDGNLDYGWEKIVETYYDCQIWKTIHASLDYQFIDDPAFNHARGPVSVFAARLHWEF